MGAGTNIGECLEWQSLFKKYLWLAYICLHIQGQVMGQVLARAQITRAQVSPFESRLVLALGYKHLELASHIKLETGPRLADPWCRNKFNSYPVTRLLSSSVIPASNSGKMLVFWVGSPTLSWSPSSCRTCWRIVQMISARPSHLGNEKKCWLRNLFHRISSYTFPFLCWS